jgi:hypothetical protein
MLSRVTSMEGLLILRPFPASKITQRMSQELRDELARLDRLDTESRTRFSMETIEYITQSIETMKGAHIETKKSSSHL